MALPPDWTTVPVTATYLDKSGIPMTGYVVFTDATYVTADGDQFVPTRKAVELDGSGSISLSLPSTDDPDIAPAGWLYTVTEYVNGMRRVYNIAVPHDSPGINLATVVPSVPVDPTAAYLTADDVGSAAYADLPPTGDDASAAQVVRGDDSRLGSATVDNAIVNAAVSTDPAATRTALELGTAAQADATMFDPASAASDAISAHESAVDPHPQYTTASEAAAAAPVQSVNAKTGAVSLTAADVGAATSTQGAVADTALQPGDIGVANLVAPLGADAKVPVAYLPAAVVGQVDYQGTWAANTGSPPSTTPKKGWYYIVTVAGATDLDGVTDWEVGDWAIYNGATWNKVDNTDAVSSVAGLTGAITSASLKTSMGLDNVDNTADADKPVSIAQQTALDEKYDKTGGTIGGPVSIPATSADGSGLFYDPALNLLTLVGEAGGPSIFQIKDTNGNIGASFNSAGSHLQVVFIDPVAALRSTGYINCEGKNSGYWLDSWWNTTTGAAGDVMVLDITSDVRTRKATTADTQGIVVGIGGWVNAPSWMHGRGEAPVNADAGAINRGDRLVVSTNIDGCVMADTTGDPALSTVGYAITTKAAGAAGKVTCVMRPTVGLSGTVTAGSFTVATLPLTAGDGATLWCADARVGTETAGNGKGCHVVRRNGGWVLATDYITAPQA